MRWTLPRCVAVALAARLLAVALWPVSPAWDGHYYARLAAQLAAGNGYSEPLGGRLVATAFWPPGLPLALAPLIALGASPHAAAVVVNLAACALACAAIHHAALRRADARTAARATLGYALYPGLVLWSGATMTETLTGALIAAALLVTARRRPLLTGALIGYAALLRPASLLILPAALLAAPRAGSVARCLLGAALVVLPWSARNARVLDAPALISTNGGSNLLIGATSRDGGYEVVRARHPRCDHAAGEVARDRCWRALALREITRAPLRWLARATLRLGRTFVSELDPAAHLAWSQRPPPRALVALLGALCTVAWWWLLMRGAPRLDVQCGLALGVTALTHAVFLGADRYHLVLVPLLCAHAGDDA